jgi:hypothetical protein
MATDDLSIRSGFIEGCYFVSTTPKYIVGKCPRSTLRKILNGEYYDIPPGAYEAGALGRLAI